MSRARIGIYGKMNSGKSSLFNFLLASNEAIVSAMAGTTTDPVRKAYELLGWGAVTLIDTAGFDDAPDGLALQRVEKTMSTISEVDVALFVPFGDELDGDERLFINRFDIPVVVAYKPFSATIFDQLVQALKSKGVEKTFYGSYLSAGERVLLVAPIDSEAPVGRLILPQVQALRAALDLNAYAMIVQPSEMDSAVEMFKPDLIVIDSQLFGSVGVREGIRMTSFSVLLSDYKGDLELYKRGAMRIGSLKDGDKILLIEHCVHGVSCQDIARVKIPAALRHYGVEIEFDIVSGREQLPDDLSPYALAVQCGGCMTTPRAIESRIKRCSSANLPITSYGILLHYLASAK